MASNLSQDFIEADRFISRRYVQIPKDQAQLLDNDGDRAWYENLSRDSRPMVNVPPGVLENLHRRKSADIAQRLSHVQPESFNAASTPPGAPHGEDDEEADEGVPISWSQSPPRPPPDQSIQRAEQTLPLIGFPTSPEGTQPRREAPPAYVENAPSSSAVQSEGLEMQPLEALSQESGAPVNRPAVRAVATDSNQPGATPPSAQEHIIPSTFSGTCQSDEQEPPAKKQRRLDKSMHPNIDSGSREQSVIPKASPRPLPMAPGSNQQSSSTNISTPLSIVKAASEQSRQSSLPKAVSASGVDRDSSSNFTPTWEGRRAAMATQRENIIKAPASSLPLSGPQPAQADQRGSTPNRTRRSLGHTRNDSNARTPYEKFKLAYPDYQESANMFVSALLNVERLKRDWALPGFLYDDFVRAFSTGYLQYISMSLITDADKILTAVQWYNDNVKNVEYRQNVITKNNIHDMVKAHAIEVRKVRKSIGGSELTVDGAAPKELDEDPEDEDQQDEQGVGARVPGEVERKEGVSAPARSPELHIGSPGMMEVETTTGLIGSEAPLKSRTEPADGEQTSHLVAGEFDMNGQSLLEDNGFGDSPQRRFLFAEMATKSADKLVSDQKEWAASNSNQSDTQMDEAAGGKESGASGAEVEHAMDDDMPVSKMSPELSISSPGLETTGVAASIEDERQEDVDGIHRGAGSPTGSFASQEDVQMEDSGGDEEPEDGPEDPMDIAQPRVSPEIHRQSPGVVFSEGSHRKEATPEVKATPGPSKSSAVRQSVRKSYKEVSTPVASETDSVSRRFLAPLPSSPRSPSRSRTTNTNGDETVQKRADTPPAKKVQDAFNILADSSDEEDDAFDPPTEKAAVQRPWTEKYSLAAFQTQAPISDEESDAFEEPVNVPKPPQRTAARSSPAIKSGSKPRTSMTPVASTAAAATSNRTEVDQKIAVAGHRRVLSRVSTGSFSGAGKSGSPVSSERSYANVPMSKKRVKETKEERSRRLKEHFRKRMSGKTPSSTAMSKQ